MMNNENKHSHSPSQQVAILRKRIDMEQQKSNQYDDRIKQLKIRVEAAKIRNQQRRQRLTQITNKIQQQKQKGQQLNVRPVSQNSQQGESPSESSSNIFSQDSSIIQQLREHYKALRMQLLMQDDDDDYEDQVDVDNMTYEQLLELGEKIGKVSKGLDMKKMSSLEVKPYHSENPNQSLDCAICREELEEGCQTIKLACKHTFHQQCIKGWLNVEKHCPNCKQQVKH